MAGGPEHPTSQPTDLSASDGDSKKKPETLAKNQRARPPSLSVDLLGGLERGKPYTPTPTQLKNAKKACSSCGRLTVKKERKSCKSCGCEEFTLFSRQAAPSTAATQASTAPKSTAGATRTYSKAKSVSVVSAGDVPPSTIEQPPSPGTAIAGISERMSKVTISPATVHHETLHDLQQPPAPINLVAAATPAPEGTTTGSGSGAEIGAGSGFCFSSFATNVPLPICDEANRALLSQVAVSPLASSSSSSSATRKTFKPDAGEFGPPAGSPRLEGLAVLPTFQSRAECATSESSNSDDQPWTVHMGSQAQVEHTPVPPAASKKKPRMLTIDPAFPDSPLLDLQNSFPTPPVLAGLLRFTGVLGKGAYSTVFKGELIDGSGRRVAIKCVDKNRSESKRLKLEIQSLKNAHHKNIVELLYVRYTSDTLYIITELVEGGELFDRICDLGSFSEKDAAGILKQILDALVFLHANGIVHRDIKPENILIGEGIDDIKIADFGVATMFDMCNGRGDSSSDESDGEPHADHAGEDATDPELHVHARFRRRCYSLVGSLQYMAPEILSGAGYTASVDLWSVGVLAHILVAGFPPFDIPSQDALKAQSKLWSTAGMGVPLFDDQDPIWQNISVEAQRFIQSLMAINPSMRPTAVQALEFPWIQRHTNPAFASRSTSVASWASLSSSREGSPCTLPGAGAGAGLRCPTSSLDPAITGSSDSSMSSLSMPVDDMLCPDIVKPEIAQNRSNMLRELSIDIGRKRDKERMSLVRDIQFGEPVIGLSMVDEDAPNLQDYAHHHKRRIRSVSDRRRSSFTFSPARARAKASNASMSPRSRVLAKQLRDEGYNPTPKKQTKMNRGQVAAPSLATPRESVDSAAAAVAPSRLLAPLPADNQNIIAGGVDAPLCIDAAAVKANTVGRGRRRVAQWRSQHVKRKSATQKDVPPSA